jgi:protoporphyrinogen oxidase
MRYGIVGGGILGLTACLRLTQAGHTVVLLERDPGLGGLAASFEVAPGLSLERFYHHIFRTDRRLIALLRELGLGDQLEWYRPISSVMVGGQAHQLDSPMSLVRFGLLPLGDRLRMGGALALLKLLPTPGPLDRATADRWMRRACGERGHEMIWAPLLRSKFGMAAGDVSMAWLWARIHDRTSELGYLHGGFERMYDALRRACVATGSVIELGVTVTGIDPIAVGFEVRGTGSGGSRTWSVDRVILALPPNVAADLVPAARLGREWTGQRPLSAQCLILELDRPLTGTYWIGTTDRTWPFLAVVEHTAMLSPSAYGGRHLVYLGAYRPDGDPLLSRTAGELVEAATNLLVELNRDYDPAWITKTWAFTAPNAQPIIDPGYRDRIPGFSTALAGLYQASMFQVYPHDRGQNYSVELAERLVAHLEGA